MKHLCHFHPSPWDLAPEWPQKRPWTSHPNPADFLQPWVCPEQVPPLPQTFTLQGEKLMPSSEQSCADATSKPCLRQHPRAELLGAGSERQELLRPDPLLPTAAAGAGTLPRGSPGTERSGEAAVGTGAQWRRRGRWPPAATAVCMLQGGSASNRSQVPPNAALQDRRDNSIGGTRAN